MINLYIYCLVPSHPHATKYNSRGQVFHNEERTDYTDVELTESVNVTWLTFTKII